jgi:cysteine desulfurase/selenocysteine lyase
MFNCRTDFPLFTNNPNVIYLDTAASAQKPQCVIDAISTFYSTSYANIHRGSYGLSHKSTELYEEARGKVKEFIHASSTKEVIFTRSATESLNLLSTVLSEDLHEGDEIMLSLLEHHANLIPWQQVAKTKNVILKFINFTQDGDIDLVHLEDTLSSRTKIVSLSHCSNVLGTITSFPKIRELLNKKGIAAILIADASQSVPHFNVSVKELEVDFLVFSGHKLYGPSGIGVLWGQEKFLSNLSPYQTGGDMIRTVFKDSATWNELPWKFEAGTPNIEGAIGLGAAIDYLNGLSMESVSIHTQSITQALLDELTLLPSVSVLGKPDPKSGIVSFTVDGIHPHDIAETMNSNTICIRAGNHCASPLHSHLNIHGSCRISIGVYTTVADIEACIDVLKELIADFNHV